MHDLSTNFVGGMAKNEWAPVQNDLCMPLFPSPFLNQPLCPVAFHFVVCSKVRLYIFSFTNQGGSWRIKFRIVSRLPCVVSIVPETSLGRLCPIDHTSRSSTQFVLTHVENLLPVTAASQCKIKKKSASILGDQIHTEFIYRHLQLQHILNKELFGKQSGCLWGVSSFSSVLFPD